jgi:hypothetical protein
MGNSGKSMIGQHVQDALVQVRELQQSITNRLRFKGFSGPTRAVSGTVALVMAAIMYSPWFPASTEAHLVGWGSVFTVGFCLNAGALIYWFLSDPAVKRNVHRLSPVLDVLAPLAVGGILTATLILHGMHRYLFGTWMCMFGLINLVSRHVLPRSICLVGLFYIGCGGVWLLAPGVSFLNPWPMGLVFFAGEWAGGIILYLDERRYGEERMLIASKRGQNEDT